MLKYVYYLKMLYFKKSLKIERPLVFSILGASEARFGSLEAWLADVVEN